ncbi:MAG: 5-deoxy-glucuronate isomerase [Christensenellaceae bacterium]|jgi:5-deoxy-glucuronate isomerase
MFIEKEKLLRGKNVYVDLEDANGKKAGLGVEVWLLEPGDVLSEVLDGTEAAYILFEGQVEFIANEKAYPAKRKNLFEEDAYCLHASAGTKIEIQAKTNCEIFVQKAKNERAFDVVMYAPDDVVNVRAGENVLQDAMRRDIKTFFDYHTAPYSNMVLGEILCYPGRWSSYPPHAHVQPEIYFFKFDKPQGFGLGLCNGNAYKTTHNSLMVITEEGHSQVTAPGYACCYVWGIVHLPGNPWLREESVFDKEHQWLLAPDVDEHILQEK